MGNVAEVGQGTVLMDLILGFVEGGGPRLYLIMKVIKSIGKGEETHRGGCASPGSL